MLFGNRRLLCQLPLLPPLHRDRCDDPMDLSPDANARFNREVLAPLFAGLPQFPYNMVYGDWGAFRSFLQQRGVPDYQIPQTSPQREEANLLAHPEGVREDDFFIQVLLAYVLREISQYIRQHGRIYLDDTEWQAVKCFLQVSQRHFAVKFRGGLDIQAASRFQAIGGAFEGGHSLVLNGAVQRLDFFYRTEIAREARYRLSEQAAKPVEHANRRGEFADGPRKEEIVVNEEFVGRVYKAVLHHPQLRNLIEQVNIRLQPERRQLDIALEREEQGVFAVGQTKIDLRNVLLRIFSAMKPEAELLLNFLVSKVQPNRVNIIELNYERGLAEFELGVMLDEGQVSQELHRAIIDCNTDTTFPALIAVCSALLEEILGKKVQVYLNRRGEVVVELPEIEERHTKNLAATLRRKIEDAVLQEGIRQKETEEVDPEALHLQSLGQALESEAEQRWRDEQRAIHNHSELVDAPIDAPELDQVLSEIPIDAPSEETDPFLSTLAERLRQASPAKMPPSTTPDALSVAGSRERRLAETEAKIQQTLTQLPPVAAQESVFDRQARLAAIEAKLKGSDARTKTPTAAEPSGENAASPPRKPSQNSLYRALIAAMREQGVAYLNADRETQARLFLLILDRVSRQQYGRPSSQLIPEISGLDDIKTLAQTLDTLRRQQANHVEQQHPAEPLIAAAAMALVSGSVLLR